MKALAVVSLVLSVSFLTQPVASQVQDDTLIVPGMRIGKFALQSTSVELGGLVGWPPDDRLRCVGDRMLITSTPGYHKVTWWLKKSAWDLKMRAYTQDLSAQPIELLQLEWNSHACELAGPGCRQPEPSVEYKTDRGITFGSTRAAVEAAYGVPTWVDAYRVSYPPTATISSFDAAFATYDKLGMSVWFRDGKVEWFFIFRPGKSPTKHNKSGGGVCS